jgi:hypothetical protein
MISEIANKNHEELFPNHKSTLKITDPELRNENLGINKPD